MADRKLLTLIVILLGIVSSCTIVFADTEKTAPNPFESSTWSTPENAVDLQVKATLRQHGAQFRPSCSDEVFIRRVYVDMIGTLPKPEEVTAFLADQSSNKRTALIDSLFTRDEFADYWAMKWCDILRVKSEFPMNLWPNAVQAYHHWIRQSIHDNMPYDQFSREMLTASGSNFRVPPVNFYRALAERDPASIAKGVGLSFMGVRAEKWPQSQLTNMAVFFSRVSYKKTAEWKEEIVYVNPESIGPIKVVYPDGTTGILPAGSDPREAFAAWLTAPGNKWFARNIVNRIWFWLMGRGIIHEADDIRPDNPPASPATLACLENALVKSHYDLRSIYRLILTSHTYQQSSIPHNDIKDASIQFAHYTIRRLDAEVLCDALCWIGNRGVGYSSATPEPYTFVPKENRTIALADGSITSAFLATFGRPARDTGLLSERDNKPTDSQRLYLLNSSDIQRWISQSSRLRDVIMNNLNNQPELVRNLYVTILSRYPTPDEAAIADQYFKKNSVQGVGPTANDIAWALINSKEFLYRH
ncbi:MAG TPA: DUF1553 domain-containing protein [Armatimonadota bacterium]|nr:DUF1553 domain-containing protein [Armatimonadota bacterium]